MILILARLCLWFSLVAFVAPAVADEKQDLDNLRGTTLNLIRLLVREGILTQDKADALIKEAEKKTAPAPSVAGAPAVSPGAAGATNAEGKPVVRVPYVPEVVKQEIREQIKQEVLAQAKAERWGDPGAAPEWLDRITLDGDLRMRLQKDIFQSDNAPAVFFQSTGVNINNTTDDRERLRLRTRIGLQAKVADWMSAGIRLTTGSATDPLSTNQTLGNFSNKYQVLFDLAYLKLDPKEWLTVAGGRIPNPWFSTDLMWNDNLTFEGAALTFKPQFRDDLKGFLTLGAFPLQEIEPALTTRVSSKWLYGAQAGFEWISPQQSRFKAGAAVYDFRKIEGTPNAFDSTAFNLSAPQFRQKGNSVFNIDNSVVPINLFALASRFKTVNLTGLIDLATFDPVRVSLIGDYAKNIGFDSGEILRRTGLVVEPRTTAWMTRLQVGMPQLRNPGDWQAFFGYKHLERDSVPDAFNDSDFHLGGTNAKGFFLGGSYGLARNSWLTMRWLSSTQIDGAPLAIDVLQLDFNARF